MTGALIQAASAGGYVELEATYLSQDLDLAAASAQIKFHPDGTIDNHNGIEIGQWHNPTGGSPGAGYQVRATANPDTPDSGTMNTWLAMSGTNTWTENRSGSAGTDEKVFDIEIRPTGGSVIASTTVTLRATIVI